MNLIKHIFFPLIVSGQSQPKFIGCASADKDSRTYSSAFCVTGKDEQEAADAMMGLALWFFPVEAGYINHAADARKIE